MVLYFKMRSIHALFFFISDLVHWWWVFRPNFKIVKKRFSVIVLSPLELMPFFCQNLSSLAVKEFTFSYSITSSRSSFDVLIFPWRSWSSVSRCAFELAFFSNVLQFECSCPSEEVLQRFVAISSWCRLEGLNHVASHPSVVRVGMLSALSFSE